ncbi:MAG: type II/IV secretion system protein, partial [Chloroflexi bacterium]|nr:type II/IV secretion system protein [Chloroflexota bacterium]
ALALPRDLQDAIDRSYRVGGEIATELLRMPTSGDRRLELGIAEMSATAIAEAPVVKAIDMLLRQGARDKASDIHIEPQERDVRIRFRIDGILHETMALPMGVHPALISRIKIMANMNIAETRVPQDGQISFRDADREIDVRVATAPTVHGEMAVLRLLDKSFAFRTLPELGFLPDTLETYKTLLQLPFGMILISGPTGSGKTTTLYASVNQMDNVERNVITIEDPVEYRFKSINQIQVNPTANVTFAAGLRATMRLDPDVILVGEIRDSETARIAVQAALTGHLVLSSIHANDTAGVIYRLIDLGVEPFLVASAVIGVVAQRMVRRVCPNCSRVTSVPSEEQLAYEREMGEKRTQFIYGAGCNFCARTGYLGRTGIYEVMVLTEGLRRLILTGAGTDPIRHQAIQEGLITLWHDGMLKVKTGVTTPYEVIRNVYTIG